MKKLKWIGKVAALLAVLALVGLLNWEAWMKQELIPVKNVQKFSEQAKSATPAKTVELAKSAQLDEPVQLIHIVSKGECLIKIAKIYEVDWTDLWLLNLNLDVIGNNPDLIHPEQELEIPKKGGLYIFSEKRGLLANYQKAKAFAAQADQTGPFYWDRANGDPFGKQDFVKAIQMFNVPDQVKAEWIKLVQDGQFEDHLVKQNDHFEEMVFGNYKIRKNVVARFAKSPQKEYEAKKYTTVFEKWEYVLVSPVICNNWGWFRKREEKVEPAKGCLEVVKEAYDENGNLITPVPQFTFIFSSTKLSTDLFGYVKVQYLALGQYQLEEQLSEGWELMTEELAVRTVEVKAGEDCAKEIFKNKKKVPPRVEQPPPLLKKKLLVLLIPPAQVPGEPPPTPPAPLIPPSIKFVKENADLIMGAGNYQNFHPDQDADGYYGWIKSRWRPLDLSLADNLDLNLGAFAFGAGGRGHDRDYQYQWHEYAVGPSAQLVGKGWDADIDSGFGQLWNFGGAGLYDSKQAESIFLQSAHLNYYPRRLQGNELFPKVEANVEFRLPFSSDHSQNWNGQTLAPDPADNRVLDFWVRPIIYDIKVSENYRVSPAIHLGAGREWAAKSEFLQFGPNIYLGHQNDDIANVSFLNYKEMLQTNGDQWHPIALTLDAGKIIKKIYRAYTR